MKATERKRLENKTRKDLVKIIDDLQGSLARWKDQYGTEAQASVQYGTVAEFGDTTGGEVEKPPFYWAIGYIGWGSWDTDIDFIDGGETCSTPQQAVDAWEDLRKQGTTQAYDQDNLGQSDATLLVYRIDEIGRASTDRRWVFRTQKP